MLRLSRVAMLRLSRVAAVACQRYPLVRDVTIFGSLFVGAELSQQTLLKKVWKVDTDPNYDFGTLGRYAVFGVLFYPIVYNRWYKFLELRFPGKSPLAVTSKVFTDQFSLEPCLIVAFYVGMSIMEGKEDIFMEAKLKFLPTYIAGCLFWLPATATNFFLVPPALRVVYIGVCSFAWCNFRCWLKRKQFVLTGDDVIAVSNR